MKILLTMINAKDFMPLSENEYTENIFRNDDKSGYFQTHIYFRDSKKNFYIPAFSIEDAAGDYSLEFSADKDGTERKKFQRHSKFYYDENLGWNVAGKTYIFVLKNGKTIETHKLLILPDRAECAAMIKELLSIRRELFQNSIENNSSLAENLREKTWEEILKTLNEQAEEIFQLMKKIDARLRFSLKKIQQDCSVSKIRRFDEKIIRQYIANPKRKKFQVSADKVSMNIFENRLLKNKIWRLKEFIETQTKLQKIRSETLKQDIESLRNYINSADEKISRRDRILTENTLENLKKKSAENEANEKVLQTLPNKILEILEKCLCLKVFREAENKSEKWRMTQIFTNDANYRRAYLKLKELDEIFDFSFDADEKSFPAEKIYRLYEWWVLAKIVEFLIVKLHWKSEDNTPAEILRKLFNNLENIQSAKISLTHENSKMKMEIFYNTEINESLQTTGCNLRPDYLFKVTANDATKIFILDAKYRNYENQGFYFWKEKDLKGVCFEKYIKQIESVIDKKISMSFIVHTDRTPNKTGRFLGNYVVYNGTVLFNELFSELNGELQQVGTFYLSPEMENDSNHNQSEINLTLFFKMMFEYFMEQWKICWECGVAEVEVEEKVTSGGYPKYYLRCKNCGEFWVKSHCWNCSNKSIIKHSVNYHVEESPWYILCPSCRK